ncbi:MAG: hypothetical protein ACERK6_01430 [Candidatus Aminicenantaceae bacterium]
MQRSNRWRWPLGLLVLLTASCSSMDYFRLQLRIPRRADVRLADFDGIVVGDFLLKSEVEDFDINRELRDYLSTELSVELETQVDLLTAPLSDESVFEDRDFWKSLDLGKKRAVIFSGTVEYSDETRKALIHKKGREQETPFPDRDYLKTQKFYSLNIQIHIIDSESGINLYHQEFKEQRSYSNPNQTAYFAFFDLAYQIKEKLFREIMGGNKIQDRYLIIH